MDSVAPLPMAEAPFPRALERAMSALEERLERFPAYPDLWNRLGLCRAARGRLDEASGCFERALAANPRFLGAVENRAWAAVAAGDAFGWQRFHDGPDYVRLHPGVRHHLLLFATARFESLERALVMSSMPPQGRYEAAHLLDRLWLLVTLDRRDEARLLVEDVTCSDPALRGSFTALGLLAGPVAEAAEAAAGAAAEPAAGGGPFERWRSAYAFNPQLGEVYAFASRDSHKRGELRDSRALVEWALALSLDLPGFWVNLALHYEAAGELPRVVPCLERAVAANPQHRRARKELALALMARGRNREAIAEFERLRGIAPAYADVRFHLGILYMDRGDLAQAADELSAALAANPRYTRAALILARVRHDQGRWAEARAGYERVLADGLDGCDLRVALAEVLGRLGEDDAAATAFERAAALAPDDTGLLRSRADWLERTGRKDEAARDRARLDTLLREHPLDEAA